VAGILELTWRAFGLEESILPLNAASARSFAQEWADAWNSHDLERILAHYAEDVVLTSPVALQRFGGDGTVRGKAALRSYFEGGLKAFPDLHFELIETLWGLETVVVCFINSVRGSKCAEVMLLNRVGKVAGVWANYE
jgi:hypothetical protein